jgi:hypothetical protein
MDTSKHVFQLHGVNAAEVPILRKKLRRKEMVTFFQKLAPAVIAIEACGASRHLARLLQLFGHTVKLIAPHLVKPYVKHSKNGSLGVGSLGAHNPGVDSPAEGHSRRPARSREVARNTARNNMVARIKASPKPARQPQSQTRHHRHR